jgi:hypothetical protein
MMYQRMVAAGVGPASLDALLKPPIPSQRPGVSPAPRVPADPGAPPRGDSAVDIRTLIYKGEGARKRAQELREAAKRVGGDQLRAIIDEVCDLVVLAIEPDA